jgi:hypothetical protein
LLRLRNNPINSFIGDLDGFCNDLMHCVEAIYIFRKANLGCCKRQRGFETSGPTRCKTGSKASIYLGNAIDLYRNLVMFESS